jgi:hypothetical protein
VTSRSTDEYTSPARPQPDDPVERGLEHRSADQPSRWKTVLVIVVAVLVVGMFLALHLTGAVGPGAH